MLKKNSYPVSELPIPLVKRRAPYSPHKPRYQMQLVSRHIGNAIAVMVRISGVGLMIVAKRNMRTIA